MTVVVGKGMEVVVMMVVRFPSTLEVRGQANNATLDLIDLKRPPRCAIVRVALVVWVWSRESPNNRPSSGHDLEFNYAYEAVPGVDMAAPWAMINASPRPFRSGLQ